MKVVLVFLIALVLSVSAHAKDTFTTIEYGQIHSLGLKRDSISLERFKADHLSFSVIDTDTVIPGHYDLTDKVSPPEDQGGCGSCWDFSLTKALRSALMLAGKDPGTLAFNYLLNNCGPGPSQGGCGGGDFDAGLSFLNGAGPWLESQDRYTQSEGNCKHGLAVAGTSIDFVTVGSSNKAPSFQELAAAISQNHMLSIDVAACGKWMNYSTGIYNSNCTGINHMINGNGYNMETSVDAQGNAVFNAQGEPINGDGYLIVMNNWNTTWGEKGYMRTRAHKNQIADTAMYFVVK